MNWYRDMAEHFGESARQLLADGAPASDVALIARLAARYGHWALQE